MWRQPPPLPVIQHPETIEGDRSFESRRQASTFGRTPIPGGEAAPSRAVSARLTVIARRIVTCYQTTSAGSC
jgi:hypothetical protein